MTNAEQPMDHVSDDDGVAQAEPSELEKNVKSKKYMAAAAFHACDGHVFLDFTYFTRLLRFPYSKMRTLTASAHGANDKLPW